MPVANRPEPVPLESAAAPCRVVIVDDERVVLRLVRTVLELDGHEVYEFLNGAIGLGLIGVVTPDVVVLDVMMPGMDGVEVCRHISRDHPEVQVLILTGSGDPAVEVRCREAGAAAYMTKPVLPDALSLAVAGLAARHPGRVGGGASSRGAPS